MKTKNTLFRLVLLGIYILLSGTALAWPPPPCSPCITNWPACDVFCGGQPASCCNQSCCYHTNCKSCVNGACVVCGGDPNLLCCDGKTCYDPNEKHCCEYGDGTTCSNDEACCNGMCVPKRKVASATEALFAYFLVEGVGLRPYNHTVHEIYYSCINIQTISSIVVMRFGPDINNIATWVEKHKYSWNGDETDWVTMTISDGLVGEGEGARGCSVQISVTPDGLKGIGKCDSLLWDYGGGHAPGIITNAEVDCAMPE